MANKEKIILVVDDDEDILKLLNKILTSAGFTVYVADNPGAARKILSTHTPQLIISDLNMEPEDGFEFIKSIREQKPQTQIPIIVLSALLDFASVKKVMSLGISDYVIKPVQAPMLLRKLRKVLLYNDFSRCQLPEDQRYKISVEIPSYVTSINEAGCILSGPIKVSDGRDIKIKVPDMKVLGTEGINCVVIGQTKVHQTEGIFKNMIIFSNSNEEA